MFWLCCVHVCGRRGAPQLQYIVAVVVVVVDSHIQRIVLATEETTACTVGGPQ